MRRLVLASTIAALALAAPAAFAGGSGITPVAPKGGDTVRVGSRPTFKLRVRGRGAVFVRVCKSRKRDKHGLICHRESFGRAKKKGKLYVYKAPFFDYPSFWLNSPGTYYWQAARISCENGLDDCRLESPTIKFKVR
jgi:hypothetical protein